MKVLFKKYLLNPIITGPIHTRVGTIDFEDIQLEMLDVLYAERHLEGYVILTPKEEGSAAEKAEDIDIEQSTEKVEDNEAETSAEKAITIPVIPKQKPKTTTK